MAALESAGLPVLIAVFLMAGLVILVAGTRLSAAADRFADLSGLGEALTGALVLGAMTSLPGLVASVWAAATGHPELAVANALGGIAVQTLFLALADMVWPRTNLEHAAPSLANMMSGTMLIILITLALGASLMPPVTLLGVHPASVLLVVTYIAGLRLGRKAEAEGAWQPGASRDAKRDVPDAPPGAAPLPPLVARIVLLGLLTGGAGWLIGVSGLGIARATGISEGVVGMLLTGVASSTPELVTTVAAVRRGALTLAVGGILGGNAFDVLFMAASDAAYRAGSLFHAITERQTGLMALVVLMTAILLLGLLRRERQGMGNIGFESLALILCYGLGVGVLTVM